MILNQVSLIVYFNLLLQLSVVAEKFSESYKIGGETRNGNFRTNGKDPFVASLNPNREKTSELLEKNIDKSALKENFYSDHFEKIILKEFSGTKKKQRILASSKYLAIDNKTDNDLELTRAESSGHLKHIHNQHNRLRHAKRKKLDELRWVKKTGKNFPSEGNFSSKKYLLNEKNVWELQGKNHRKKIHSKKYSLNDKEIFNSSDDRRDKEFNQAASLNSVESDSEKFAKFNNLSTRWKSQFVQRDDVILNSEVDLQFPRDDPSKYRPESRNMNKKHHFDEAGRVKSEIHHHQENTNNYIKLFELPFITRSNEEKEITLPKENKSSPLIETIISLDGDVTFHSLKPSSYHTTLSPFSSERAKDKDYKYNSRNKVSQETSVDEHENHNNFDVTGLLNTEPFIIPNSSGVIDGRLSRSKSMSYKSSLKTNSTNVDSSKYSSKFHDKNIPFRHNYENSLNRISSNETPPHFRQNSYDDAQSVSIIKQDSEIREYQENEREANNGKNKLVMRMNENPYPKPFSWKDSLKLLIKKPATNIRVRKSKRLYVNESDFRTPVSFSIHHKTTGILEVKNTRERPHLNISQAAFLKSENITPQCRFIDSFRKSVMASCQRQGDQNPGGVPEQLIQDPCYSIRDLLIVVVMTSLVNLLAGIIITLAFCCLPLRECCFLAHGSRVTLTTRSMQSGYSRNHSEEDSSGSVGCLEACLPDISYQRHIARGGFSKGRTFGMAQMFQHLTGSLGDTCPWERHHRRLRKDSMLISRRSLSLEDLSIT